MRMVVTGGPVSPLTCRYSGKSVEAFYPSRLEMADLRVETTIPRRNRAALFASATPPIADLSHFLCMQLPISHACHSPIWASSHTRP